MTYRISSDRAAAVAPAWHWIPIDEHTPKGVKLLLISQQYGVAHIGIHTTGCKFYSHFCPLPTFKKESE